MSDEEDEYEYDYNEDWDDDNINNDGIDEHNNEDSNDVGNQFGYTDEEEDQLDDTQVILENAYYNAKRIREVDLNQALIAFENVIQQEQKIEFEKSSSSNFTNKKFNKNGVPWSFKARKQLLKIHLRATAASSLSYHQTATTKSSNSKKRNNNTNDKTTVGSPEMILHHYNRLLECCVSVGTEAMSPAAVEKGISGMLERVVARSYGTKTSTSYVEMESTSSKSVKSTEKEDMKGYNPQSSLELSVYASTITVFHPLTGPCKNERLWFKTNLKYGQLMYKLNEITKLQQVINDLLLINNNHSNDRQHANSTTMNSLNLGATSGSMNSSTNYMEIYALQIQLYSKQKDKNKLRETYQRAINAMDGCIPHPRTSALIHELGGKMYMSSLEYELAEKTFFQAFQSFDKASDTISTVRCLKYVVFASMLHGSTINSFDSQEARKYRDDPEIVTMTELVSAFHSNEINQLELILKKNSRHLLDNDEFIREHVEDLQRATQAPQVLRRDDRVGIHDAREQQTVSIAKAGVKRAVVSYNSGTKSVKNSSTKKSRKESSNGAENLKCRMRNVIFENKNLVTMKSPKESSNGSANLKCQHQYTQGIDRNPTKAKPLLTGQRKQSTLLECWKLTC